MQYFAYAVEIAFSEKMGLDGPTFEFTSEIWDEAVLEASYVLAQEELHHGSTSADLVEVE